MIISYPLAHVPSGSALPPYWTWRALEGSGSDSEISTYIFPWWVGFRIAVALVVWVTPFIMSEKEGCVDTDIRWEGYVREPCSLNPWRLNSSGLGRLEGWATSAVISETEEGYPKWTHHYKYGPILNIKINLYLEQVARLNDRRAQGSWSTFPQHGHGGGERLLGELNLLTATWLLDCANDLWRKLQIFRHGLSIIWTRSVIPSAARDWSTD
jgi:hypothetical protein